MTIEHPYENLSGGKWLRGNLHAHTTHSDGERSRQAVVDDYAARGHGFLMISDHDIYTSPEDHAALDAKGMVLIPGNEVSAGGPHLLHVNANRRVNPDPLRQRTINEIRAAGGFAILNHPNWQDRFNHCSIEKLQEWVDYAGIEIYNGVISRLDGSPYSTNKWDILLSQGRRLWGYANDDSHAAKGDSGLGWNTVYVKDRTVKAVVESLERGRFYASTGVIITDIRVEGGRIRIETENAERIVALQQVGKRFATADARNIEVEVPASAKYVRFECWGRGEQFAWTNPFFVSGA